MHFASQHRGGDHSLEMKKYISITASDTAHDGAASSDAGSASAPPSCSSAATATDRVVEHVDLSTLTITVGGCSGAAADGSGGTRTEFLHPGGLDEEATPAALALFRDAVDATVVEVADGVSATQHSHCGPVDADDPTGPPAFVAVPDGAVVVQCGDVLRRWTSSIVKAAVHRVRTVAPAVDSSAAEHSAEEHAVALSDNELFLSATNSPPPTGAGNSIGSGSPGAVSAARLSAVYFVWPDWHAQLTPLPRRDGEDAEESFCVGDAMPYVLSDD